MFSEARAALDALDRVLARQDGASRQVWAVLTALRGPDHTLNRTSEADIKARATVPIRRAAFPRTAAQASIAAGVEGLYANGALFNVSPYSTWPGWDMWAEAGHHFAGHVNEAFAALSLPSVP
jgi:hypothetical protein